MLQVTLKYRILWMGVLLAAATVLAVRLSSCDLRRLGPPLPELFSKEYLLSHGYSTYTIQTLLSYKELPADIVTNLLQEEDASTRHLLACNAYITQDQRKLLLADKNAYVRGGVAMNPSLSTEEIALIRKDRSHIVVYGLAMNPFVPEHTLIALWREHAAPLSAFAKNPLCPDQIVEAIQKNGGSLDKDLLKMGQKERQKGIYRDKLLPSRDRCYRPN